VILLDTNVLSALMRREPDGPVVHWRDDRPPLEIRDVQIAGITAARKATLATRNLRHFEGLGIDLVDP